MRRTRHPGLTADATAETRLAEHQVIARKDRECHRHTATVYDRSITRTYRIYHQWDLHPWVASVARRWPGGLALDLGTGTGVVAAPLAATGFRVVALDHSPEMLAIARQRGSVGMVCPILGDVLQLPFPDEVFDVVTMQGILHHVPHALDAVLREAVRVLRPGGDFYISEPCDDVSWVGRLLRHPLWFRPFDPKGELTDEEAIPWSRAAAALAAAGLRYRVRFLTHIPSAHFHFWLPDRLRLAITRALSLLCRRGDLFFVHGRKG